MRLPIITKPANLVHPLIPTLYKNNPNLQYKQPRQNKKQIKYNNHSIYAVNILL